MTRHELKVILAATGLSKTAPVVEVPSEAIINRWTPKHIEKIRGEILPQLLGVEA